MVAAKIDKLRELLYRCLFLNLVDEARKMRDADLDDATLASTLELSASALFELHRIDEVKDVAAELGALAKKSSVARGELLYLKGKIAYFEDDYDVAQAAFREASLHQDQNALRMRARLGLGNVCYSRGDRPGAVAILGELGTLEGHARSDLQISRAMLAGNIALTLDQAPDAARPHFRAAFGAAAPHGWTYFMQRALDGLARAARADQRPEEMQAYVEILRATIDEREALFMAHLFNKEFAEDASAIDSAMDFDEMRMAVRVRDQWRSLHERPLVYRFLRFLHGRPEFATKEAVAQSLWPDENYRPDTHDPRVYDIARRARSIVEAFESQPIVLLSGRSGYRLATKTEESRSKGVFR